MRVLDFVTLRCTDERELLAADELEVPAAYPGQVKYAINHLSSQEYSHSLIVCREFSFHKPEDLLTLRRHIREAHEGGLQVENPKTKH